MKKIKKFIESLAASRGYYVGKLPPSTGNLESHLSALFDHLDINCVFDVGAHFGEYGSMLRQFGYRGRIVSWEPVYENYRELEKNVTDDPDWFIHDYALGDASKELMINVTESTVCASFLDPSEYGKEQMGAKMRLKDKETVQVKRLDTVIDDCVTDIATPRIYLKMDTQGYDLLVLEGAGESLNKVLAMQSELSIKPIYGGMPAYQDTISFLSERGFELSGLFPVTLDRNMRLIEMDGVMVKVP